LQIFLENEVVRVQLQEEFFFHRGALTSQVWALMILEFYYIGLQIFNLIKVFAANWKVGKTVTILVSILHSMG